jgi:hypothetical protein
MEYKKLEDMTQKELLRRLIQEIHAVGQEIVNLQRIIKEKR